MFDDCMFDDSRNRPDNKVQASTENLSVIDQKTATL